MDVTAHQAEHFCYFICVRAETKTHIFIQRLNQLPQFAHTKVVHLFRLPNNESTTYITSGNNILRNYCLLLSPPSLSLVLFLFYSFSLIVCNSYQVSLGPTSVASNRAVGKPTVCCRHFIGFQGGGLLLFSVILARQ